MSISFSHHDHDFRCYRPTLPQSLSKDFTSFHNDSRHQNTSHYILQLSLDFLVHCSSSGCVYCHLAKNEHITSSSQSSLSCQAGPKAPRNHNHQHNQQHHSLHQNTNQRILPRPPKSTHQPRHIHNLPLPLPTRLQRPNLPCPPQGHPTLSRRLRRMDRRHQRPTRPSCLWSCIMGGDIGCMV